MGSVVEDIKIRYIELNIEKIRSKVNALFDFLFEEWKMDPENKWCCLLFQF